MHNMMASIVSLGKIEILEVKVCMLSKARLNNF